MNLVAKLGVLGIVTASGLSFFACSSSTDTGSSNAGASSSSSGAGGQGGAASGSSSSSSSSGDGGAAFIDCPVSPATFAMGECDILNPDCPPGKACYPIIPFGGSKLITQCVTWTGVKGLGAVCSTNEECEAGLICAIYCSPPCCPTPGVSACDCSITAHGFTDPNASVQACNYLPICELFAPDACSNVPGTQCHLQNINQDLATCAPPAADQHPPMEGKMCKYINDCEEMQNCNGGVCRYNCLLDSWMDKAVAEGGCPPPQTCVQLVPGKNTGLCQP